MFERYTEKARRVIFFARYEASQFGSGHIETEHILLGLLREARGLFLHCLPDVDYQSIREELLTHTRVGEPFSTAVDLALSKESKRALGFAAEEADRINDRHIGTEHLLVGLLREKNSPASQLLEQHGATLSTLRQTLVTMDADAENQGEPPKEMVEIHGSAFDSGYVQAAVRDCRRFLWEKRGFTAPDIVVRRRDGRISFDRKLAEDTSAFRLVEGGWDEVGCMICQWQLGESGDPERVNGYTNGRDWLCRECHEKFVAPDATSERQ